MQDLTQSTDLRVGAKGTDFDLTNLLEQEVKKDDERHTLRESAMRDNQSLKKISSNGPKTAGKTELKTSLKTGSHGEFRSNSRGVPACSGGSHQKMNGTDNLSSDSPRSKLSQRSQPTSPRSPVMSARTQEYHQEIGNALTHPEEDLDSKNVEEMSSDLTSELDAAKQVKHKLEAKVKALKQEQKTNQKLLDALRIESDSMALKAKNQLMQLQERNAQNRVSGNTLVGLRQENAALDNEVKVLKVDYTNLKTALDQERDAVKMVSDKVVETRKRMSVESKQKIQLESQLRGSRVAFDLMMDRYRDIERRNKAVRNVVQGCVEKKNDRA